MGKVQFQVSGLDSNTASIFNDDVTFDGNVDANSISISGTDLFTMLPSGTSYSNTQPSSPTIGQVWIDSDSSVNTYDISQYALQADLANKASSSDFSNTEWTAYTPTLVADGGGFSLGNGSLSGRYKQLGKTIHFYLKFVFGSTTNPGGGHWNFGLPVTAYNSNFTFSAAILDDGNAWYGGIGNGNYTGLTSSFAVIIPGTSASVTTWATVGNGGPFSWTAGDNITISGSYEAA